MAHSVFPNVGLQFLSAFVHFVGVTVLTFFIARRFAVEDLASRQGWARLTLARGCVLLLLVDSYLFILSAGLVVFGIGLQAGQAACTAGIFLCIVFYATSKIFIYLFLTEKVHIVWSNGRRLRSPVYLTCVVTLCLYSVVAVVLILGRIAHFRQGDGACIIGVKPVASITLLSYDLFINVFLTTLFLWPLWRLPSISSSNGLRSVATRTLVTSLASLTTSTVNIVILTLLKGNELGWLCLASCGTDVIFNAAAMFWVTAGGARTQQTSSAMVSRERNRSGTNAGGAGGDLMLADLDPRHDDVGHDVAPAEYAPRPRGCAEALRK
ncbi:hypothetical protein C8J57DRAFT_1213856 [Mycena rebaudengoi]|nr:hypothetical protein C8J57DRAFT_1213856 [Mycena rebaudengoi]